VQYKLYDIIHVITSSCLHRVTQFRFDPAFAQGVESPRQMERCNYVQWYRYIINPFSMMKHLQNGFDLTNPTVDYFSSGFGDIGWGCGYRNTQMICSALLNNVASFKACLFGGCGFIPSILGLQGNSLNSYIIITPNNLMCEYISYIFVEWLEKAWKSGIDPDGANQLDREVYDTKKWIGTSEMYTLLTSFRIK